MRLVMLESPYAAANGVSVEEHVAYARRCLLDSLRRGEAPIASHLLYTQVLDDSVPAERQLGIDAGLAWRDVAWGSVVYTDYGVSRGMMLGVDAMLSAGKPVDFRQIGREP